MRTLVLLRGAMGSGKSTFVKEQSLEPWTLAPDVLRLMYQSPQMQPDGSYAISQQHESGVWKTLMALLEARMARGEFTVIDATHSRADAMTKYRDLMRKYRYRAMIVDFFQDVPMQVCLERNRSRGFHRVPENVIENAYARYRAMPNPTWATVYRPFEFVNTMALGVTPLDFNQYERICYLGDIHGCDEPLRDYLDEYPFDPDAAYIFLGDYFDRGIQCAQVFRRLQELLQHKNVFLLEGNHDNKLGRHMRGEIVKGMAFQDTLNQLAEAGITASEIRELYWRLGQLSFVSFGGRLILANHGGVPHTPTYLTPTADLIDGVGKYEDLEQVERVFAQVHSDVWQVHGHRNINDNPIWNEANMFNLDDGVEHGGFLRVLEIDRNGSWRGLRYKNNTFRPQPVEVAPVEAVPSANVEVNALRADRGVRETVITPTLSAFNFNDRVFRSGDWRPTTMRARGLFLNTQTGAISARAYDKFFAPGENSGASLGELKKKLVFPVQVFIKENGYLGITGWHEDGDQSFFIAASKSTTNGQFAEWFRRRLAVEVKMGGLTTFVKDARVSAVFEVIEPVLDPHIVEYGWPHLVLLDVIERTPEGRCWSYDSLVEMYNELRLPGKGLQIKSSYTELVNWEHVHDFLHGLEDGRRDMAFNEYVEGFVFRDATGFMFRAKTKWYKTWKHLRSVKQQIERGHSVQLASLYTPLHNDVYAFMRGLGREALQTMSIIDVRNQFEGNGSLTVSHVLPLAPGVGHSGGLAGFDTATKD